MRAVEYRLGRSRCVVLDTPGREHHEHAVAPRDGALNDLAVVGRARYERDASLEDIELLRAALAAHPDHLVAAIKRVLDHVLAELPRGPHDANLH
jgi:hypothetical protein